MWEFLQLVLSKTFSSKTLVVSWLTFIAGVLGYVVGQDLIAQYPAAVAVLTSVIGVVNMAVRAFTYLPLSEK